MKKKFLENISIIDVSISNRDTMEEAIQGRYGYLSERDISLLNRFIILFVKKHYILDKIIRKEISNFYEVGLFPEVGDTIIIEKHLSKIGIDMDMKLNSKKEVKEKGIIMRNVIPYIRFKIEDVDFELIGDKFINTHYYGKVIYLGRY